METKVCINLRLTVTVWKAKMRPRKVRTNDLYVISRYVSPPIIVTFSTVKFISTILLLLTFGYNLSQKQEIKFFTGSLDEALIVAKQSHKLVYVDCQTAWCGPCKSMARNVFTNSEVARFYNDQFIAISIDMDKEGTGLKQEFKITTYPTHLYLNASKDLVHRSIGYQPSAEFIRNGENALNPLKRNGSLELKYLQGNRNPNFLVEYLSYLSYNKLSTVEALDTYLYQIPEDSIKTRKVENLILQCTQSTRSLAYKKFLLLKAATNNKDQKQLSAIQLKHKQIIMESMKAANQSNNDVWAQEIINECKKINDYELLYRRIQIPYFKKKRDGHNMIQSVNEFSLVLLGDSVASRLANNAERRRMLKHVKKNYKRIQLSPKQKMRHKEINSIAEDFYTWNAFLNDPRNGILLTSSEVEMTQEWLKIAYRIDKNKKFLVH